MRVITTIEDMRAWRRIQGKNDSCCLVPTMGYLHRGHLALVKSALETNEIVIVSIFVNPTQFAPNEDYLSYPRDLPRDQQLLGEVAENFPGRQLVLFQPSVAAIYPQDHQTKITLSHDFTKILCAQSRPHHFSGVCGVVAALFNITQCTTAFFGEKDYQQLMIVRQMAKDLHFPLKVLGHKIIRDDDGLALSSRNVKLTAENRSEALRLPQLLNTAMNHINGVYGADCRKRFHQFVQDNCQEFEYFELRMAKTLTVAEDVQAGDELIILAAFIVGGVRLIDNIKFVTN